MCENYCFLCQEPKIVVGHVTQFCPNVECKKCGLKGHVRENCPNLNFIMDQKPDCNVIVLNNDAKILDFVKDIEFSDDLIPKLESKEEPLDIKSEFSENNEKSSVMPKDIEFSDEVKPKFEDKEEKLKIKNSGIDQKPNMVNSKMTRKL